MPDITDGSATQEILAVVQFVRSLSLSVAILLGVGLAEAATPPADTLLPATTRAVISLPNTPQAVDLWHKTQTGQLLDDPSMEPFIQDLRRQLEEKWREENSRLGFKWDDLRPVISGEMAFAVVHQEGKLAGLILLADATGNEAAARALLDKAEQAMLQKRAKRTAKTVAGAEVAIYDEPRRADDPPNKVRRACYFLAGGLLGAANQFEICADVLARLKAQDNNNLAGVASYQIVSARCRKEAENDQPQLRWWADPIGSLAAAQAGIPPERRRQPDLLKVARAVGFTAVKGVGGQVQLGTRNDVLARTFIYAPKPWEKSMNMFVFANAAGFPPQPWVPADVANYGSFQLDIKTAEANFEPLFDQLFGDGETGVWTDVKESFRDDPNGPGIDIDKDLIAHLGSRVTLLADYTSPTTLECERTCLAIEVQNEKALAESIRKSMESDPNVRRREFDGHVIWEMLEEELDGPAVEFEAVPGQKRRAVEEVNAGGERLIPQSSVCVANGHLFVVSSVPFLEKLLSKRPTDESLAATAEFKYVDNELKQLHPGEQSFRFFTRLDEVVRPHFDFLKNNQFPQAKTSLANAINRILNGNKDRTELRKPEIDGTKLPDFEQVRKYFGIGGGVVVTEDDGWYLISLAAEKSAPQQQAGAALGRADGAATR